MSEVRKALTAGRVTMFSEGEYSDYGHRCVFVALKDMTLDELSARADSLKSGEHRDDFGTLEAMLIRDGYILEIDITEVHLGSYGSFEVSMV